MITLDQVGIFSVCFFSYFWCLLLFFIINKNSNFYEEFLWKKKNTKKCFLHFAYIAYFFCSRLNFVLVFLGDSYFGKSFDLVHYFSRFDNPVVKEKMAYIVSGLLNTSHFLKILISGLLNFSVQDQFNKTKHNFLKFYLIRSI